MVSQEPYHPVFRKKTDALLPEALGSYHFRFTISRGQEPARARGYQAVYRPTRRVRDRIVQPPFLKAIYIMAKTVSWSADVSAARKSELRQLDDH
jgi:hypothetical protein